MLKRTCSFCKEKVKKNATICKHCRSELPPLPRKWWGPPHKKKWYTTWWGILLIFLGSMYIISALIVTFAPRPSETEQQLTQTDQKTTESPIKDIDILAMIEDEVEQIQSHLKKRYYPTDGMLKELSGALVVLTATEQLYSMPPKPLHEKEQKVLSKAKMLRPKVELLKREVYAGVYERKFLERGVDANIEATGEGKRTLLYKHVFISRPHVYNIMKDGEKAEMTQGIGFERIIFENLLGHRWTYDLIARAWK